MGRLTAKSQTTVPRAVRAALALEPGDQLTYEIDGDRVWLRRAAKATPDPFTSNFSAFDEWRDNYDRVYDEA